jgi:hypothetical protein
MSAGAKTPAQRLYAMLADLERRVGLVDPARAAELREALRLLEEIDPDADADAEYVAGRVY